MQGVPTTRMRRKRKLNQPLIKSIIVALASVAAGIGSAVTGIGGHVGLAPMLSWMFGYSPEKAQGTALRFSLAAAIAAVCTYFIRNGGVTVHTGRGLLLFLGATLGALIAAPFTPKANRVGLRRVLQAAGIVVALFTITEATHLSAFRATHYASWSAWWQLLLLGIAVGGGTQASRLAGGTLLLPALFFLTALPHGSLAEREIIARGGVARLLAQEAVIESLLVVIFAGLLPAWSYGRRNLVATTYVAPAVVGGIIGGAAGAWLLPLLLERSVLIFFGLTAMFFAAREIARLAVESLPAVAAETEPAAKDENDGS